MYISFSEGETSEHRFISSIEEEPQNTLISHALKNLWTSLCLIQLGGTSEHRFISFIEKEPQNTVIYHSLKGGLRRPLYLIYWVRTPEHHHISFIERNSRTPIYLSHGRGTSEHISHLLKIIQRTRFRLVCV